MKPYYSGKYFERACLSTRLKLGGALKQLSHEVVPVPSRLSTRLKLGGALKRKWHEIELSRTGLSTRLKLGGALKLAAVVSLVGNFDFQPASS